MKAAQLVVLGIALTAGAGAMMLMSSSNDGQPAPVQAQRTDLVDVLVAAKDIELGAAVSAEDLRWQAWPSDAANAVFVQRASAPEAIQNTAGSIARSPFVAGEPIRPDKLIKGNGSGYMAAILPAGMRAISIEISPETGAGGFILPNDRVDVLLTRRLAGRNGRDESYTETLSENVRVLAIDQMVTEQNGAKVVVGKTATLELSPAQSEKISLSRQQGVIALALRSLVDSSPTSASPDASVQRKPGDSVTVVRFGIATQGGTQ